jgi:hypothetical protein
MNDVDYISDAIEVAAQAVHSHFAATLRAIDLDMERSCF